MLMSSAEGMEEAGGCGTLSYGLHCCLVQLPFVQFKSQPTDGIVHGHFTQRMSSMSTSYVWLDLQTGKPAEVGRK